MNNIINEILTPKTSLKKISIYQDIGGSDNQMENIIFQRFSVPFEYPVYFTCGLVSDRENGILRHAITRLEPNRRHRFAVIIDSNVAKSNIKLVKCFQDYVTHHSDALELISPPRIIEGGEKIKDDHGAVRDLQKWMHDLHIDRQSCIVIVGGGSILDMVGFATATSHRGVRTVRVPTTVLSQNDSGVGVKTAINAFNAKNYLGTFTPPFAVINDIDFIKTLPPRDRIAGMAEAVKVAAIRDRNFFFWLFAEAEKLAAFDPTAMHWMIRRCAELHMQHIGHGGDPFEFGSARPLDFGHWAAHKLESLSHYALTHGEAVAIGLALDTRYSVMIGMLDVQSLEMLCLLLERLGLRLWHETLDLRDDAGIRQVLQGITEFREHLGGDLTITMLTALGQGKEIHEINTELVDAAIDWLRERDAKQCA